MCKNKSPPLAHYLSRVECSLSSEFALTLTSFSNLVISWLYDIIFDNITFRKTVSIGTRSRQLAGSPNVDWTCEQRYVCSWGLSKWPYGFNGAEQGACLSFLAQLYEITVDITRDGLKQSCPYPQLPLMSQTNSNLIKLKPFLSFHWFYKNFRNQSSNSAFTQLPILN